MVAVAADDDVKDWTLVGKFSLLCRLVCTKCQHMSGQSITVYEFVGWFVCFVVSHSFVKWNMCPSL